jgi:hypothetical protein
VSKPLSPDQLAAIRTLLDGPTAPNYGQLYACARDLLAEVDRLTTEPHAWALTTIDPIIQPDLFATEQLARAEAVDGFLAENDHLKGLDIGFEWVDAEADAGHELVADGQRTGLIVRKTWIHTKTSVQKAVDSCVP